jgi:hypothetical protein
MRKINQKRMLFRNATMNSEFELPCRCGGIFKDKYIYLLGAKEEVTCPLCGITDLRTNFGPTAAEMAHMDYWRELLLASVQAIKEGDPSAAKQYALEASFQLKLAGECS